MKLIAIDMDGTLLNENLVISKKTVEAIKRVQRKGHIVIIATGRAYLDALKIIQESGLRCPILSVNGAILYNEDGERIFDCTMNCSTVEQIISLLQEEDLYCEIYTNVATYRLNGGKDKLLIELDRLKKSVLQINEDHLWNIAQKQFLQAGVVNIDNFSSVFVNKDHRYYKILAFSFDQNKLSKVKSKLKALNGIAISGSSDYNIEVTNELAQKGASLIKAAEYYQIPMSETVAIGDSYNDVSMFRVAGVSIAMGNAEEIIKSQCMFTTKSNDEDGVAYALDSFLDFKEGEKRCNFNNV